MGCRIYMCSLNIISQILCIQQDNLCCHKSRVTCTLMSISNSNIINTNQLSSLIHTKPFPWKKEQPKHAPITTVKDILSEWESTFWHYTYCKMVWRHVVLHTFTMILSELQHFQAHRHLCTDLLWQHHKNYSLKLFFGNRHQLWSFTQALCSRKTCLVHSLGFPNNIRN